MRMLLWCTRKEGGKQKKKQAVTQDTCFSCLLSTKQQTSDAIFTSVLVLFFFVVCSGNRPGSCAGEGSAATYKSSTTFPDDTLTFIKSYPLMDESVPSVNDRPYFTRTTSR